MKLLLLLVVGVGIGIVGGLVGIGGGVLLIPALTGLFGYTPRQAAGITLAVLAVPVTLPAAWRYYTQQQITSIHLQTAGLLALAFAAGTFLGAVIQHRYAHIIDDHLLRLLLGLLLLFVGVRTLMFSSTESFRAVAGLTAVAVGWLGLLFLRAVGRKHLPRPDLGEEIRRSARTSPGPDEYII